MRYMLLLIVGYMLIGASVFMVSSCSVYQEDLDIANEVCADHGGLHLYTANWTPTITCKDGWSVSVHHKGNK